MREYFYEVRGTNDPIDGDHVRFNSKQEALNYADKFSGSTVYMLEYEFSDIDPYSGGTLTQEIQIRGPEVDAIVNDPNIPDSCAADNPANYDSEGNFRLPEDDLDLDDDIETESFAEELFSAISAKRDERVFPEGDLDLEAPHEDVPVVDCKVNPAITHSEDEKPLVEAVDRSEEFYDALEDNSPAQMYVAREIVYSLVGDDESAQKLSAWGDSLEFDEQVALDSLIADALEGANEHEAMRDYINDRTLPVTLSSKLDDTGKQTMDALIASCASEQEKLDLLFQAINLLVLDGYLD